jgi:NADH dehydrogenase
MERLVQRSGVGYTIVRSASLFGMEDRFLNNIAALAVWTWPFVWLPGGGAVALQPLWVQDLVRCLVEILDRPDLLDQTVVVAGEERLRYRELVEIVLRATGHRRIPLKVGIPLARVVRAAVVGWWRRPPVTGFFLDRFTVPDIAPLDSVLRTFSFRPERLADHISYLRGAGASLLFRRYP